MNFLLTDRVALVTGAGNGNGAAIAAGLARAGALVAVTDIDEAAAQQGAERLRAAGSPAQAWKLDVCDARACADVAAKVRAAFGPIGILVNNAGILQRGRITDPDGPQVFARTMNVNVQGTFNMTHAVIGQMRELGKGAIINLASIQATVAPTNSSAYTTSKGAIVQFTKAMATELAGLGIRVNAIAPGIIATAMSEPTRSDPEKLAQFLRHVPLQRVGEPAELAGPVVFLASDAASYMTGSVVTVDGGYLAL